MSAEHQAMPVTEAEEWEAGVCGHARMLYRIAYAVLRDPHEAEDAVQETLQRAWKYRARLAQVDNPAAWLARIAWRVAKSHRPRPNPIARAQAIEELPPGVELRSPGENAEQTFVDRELRLLVQRHIQHLPQKLRQPLLLSTVEELSAREIGKILGIPEASVRTRCLRARRLLRDKLQVAMRGSHGHA